VVEFSDIDEVEAWLEDKPREIAIAIAARAALRAVPILASVVYPRESAKRQHARNVILPTFRAVATPWVLARYPTGDRDFQNISRAASHGASAAADIAGAAADAANGFEAVAAAIDAADTAAHVGAVGNDAAAVAHAVRGAAHAAELRGGTGAFRDVAAAVSGDVSAVTRGLTGVALAGRQLWHNREPEWAYRDRVRLAEELLLLRQDWEVWTEWYQARLLGELEIEGLEFARLAIEEELWEKGPTAVNGEIRRLIKEYGGRISATQPDLPFEDDEPQLTDEVFSSLEVVPKQGPGPRFRATDEGFVDRVSPAELDAEGNDTRTINQLRPLALRCADDLKNRLPPNQFGELLSAVDLYVAALDPSESKTIEWGEVWGHGVILQNAATAVGRKIDERILPALEDPAKTALESLLTIHGPMILATHDGARLSETAANFRLTRGQQETLRAAALGLAEQFKRDNDVATPRAAASVAQATASIGEGPHPERGSVFGLATIRNISIVLVGGAAIATPALIGALLGSVAIGALAGAPLSLVAVEAVKKSAAFNALVTQLGAKLDSISDDELRAWLEERGPRYAPFRRFVARNAEPLRQIAETTPELKWMLRYIDFISADKS